MQGIEGIEVNIYTLDGDGYSIPLNTTQTFILFKILGFEFQKETYSMFSEKTLNDLIKMKGNPLHLKKERN